MPYRQCADAMRDTLFPKAWRIDGQLSALSGVTGSSLSPFGIVWLALAGKILASLDRPQDEGILAIERLN